MADNWDDDDFEPEVSTFKREEPVAEAKPVDAPPKKTPAPAQSTTLKKAPAFAMESLGRELTSAEKEALQKQNDLALARDLFGDDDDAGSDKATYADISTKADFEYWGERVGGFLGSRHKAAHYGDMLGKLLGAVTENLTPADIQKMVTYLQQISTAKKTAEKQKAFQKAAPAAAAPSAAGNKKNQKATLKVTKGNDNMYDDYGDDLDDYDDY